MSNQNQLLQNDLESKSQFFKKNDFKLRFQILPNAVYLPKSGPAQANPALG